MKLANLQYVPEQVLRAGTSLNRVQPSRAKRGAVSVGGLRLAPAGLLKCRFDLVTTATGYFAESPETAIYEALARREAKFVSLEMLAKRSLVTASTTRSLRLVDLRPLASSWPVLESLRFPETQELAADIHQNGYQGIVYFSAQHHGMDCFAIFNPSLDAVKVTAKVPLVNGTGQLHRSAVAAIRGACIALVP